MKPVIGVVAHTFNDNSRPWYPPTQAIITEYIDAVVAGGGVPMVIPLIEDRAALAQLYAQVDGLLLAGGGDISPTHYGQQPKYPLDRPNPVADEVELQLLDWALTDAKPLLGICRGHELINVALGGTLHQRLSDEVGSDINHNESFERQQFTHPVHNLVIDRDSRLAELLGTPFISVVSLHQQGIDRLGTGLRVVARADDGVIEAVEGIGDQYLLGIQSHPEIMMTVNPLWRSVFQDLSVASHRYKSKLVDGITAG